jgi:hypothetical protein
VENANEGLAIAELDRKQLATELNQTVAFAVVLHQTTKAGEVRKTGPSSAK